MPPNVAVGTPDTSTMANGSHEVNKPFPAQIAIPACASCIGLTLRVVGLIAIIPFLPDIITACSTGGAKSLVLEGPGLEFAFLGVFPAAVPLGRTYRLHKSLLRVLGPSAAPGWLLLCGGGVLMSLCMLWNSFAFACYS